MTNQTRQSLEERARKAILQEAFLRWESAVVISLTLLLAVFGPLLFGNSNSALISGVALIGGILAESALVFSSLTDSEFARKVVADLLEADFHPERLKDENLQKQIQKALDYRSRIESDLRSQDASLVKDELSQTASQIDEWLEHIYGLAQRIDRYQQQQSLLPSRKQAQSRIRQLEADLAKERDQDIKQQITLTLDGLRRQIDTLDRLGSTIQRAELQLENSLTHLGTIYSQTVLADAKDIDSSRARRLRQEINDEVEELQDILLSMDEVYATEAI